MAVYFQTQFGIVISILRTKLDPVTLLSVVEMMKNTGGVFISWATFNVSLIGSIIVVREIFKVSKLRVMKETKTKNATKEEAKAILNKIDQIGA